MAKGRPNKWATAWINEPIRLGKAGIKVVISDKWGRTIRGTAIISVGGVRWFPYKSKKPRPAVTWDRLDEME